MKAKKINLNWQSLLLGMVLCAILVVFFGSMTAAPQTGTLQQKTLQRAATTSDVWDKAELIDQRILILEAKLNQIDEKIDRLQKTVQNGFNVIDRTLANRR